MLWGSAACWELILGRRSYKTPIRWQQWQRRDAITPAAHAAGLTFGGASPPRTLAKMCQRTLTCWHVVYLQAFTSPPPSTLKKGVTGNTPSVARPRYGYTSQRAQAALAPSRDGINIQFPTSHYNTIKANLLLPLEQCFGWMLSGAPTPL